VRSFKESDLPDTDNIVPFENTSRLIKSNESKIKERRAGWSDESKWYFRTVQCCQCQANLSQ